MTEHVRVKTGTPHTIRNGQAGVIVETVRKNGRDVLKVSFDDGGWGWFSRREVERV